MKARLSNLVGLPQVCERASAALFSGVPTDKKSQKSYPINFVTHFYTPGAFLFALDEA